MSLSPPRARGDDGAAISAEIVGYAAALAALLVLVIAAGPSIGRLVSAGVRGALSTSAPIADADGVVPTAAGGGAAPAGDAVPAGGGGAAPAGDGAPAEGSPAEAVPANAGQVASTGGLSSNAAQDGASLGENLGGLTTEAITGGVKLDPSIAARAVGEITAMIDSAPLVVAPTATAMTQADAETSELLTRVVTDVLSDPAVLAGLTSTGEAPGTPGESTPALTEALTKVLTGPDILSGSPTATGAAAMTQADPETAALISDATSRVLADPALLASLPSTGIGAIPSPQVESALDDAIQGLLQQDAAMASGLSQGLSSSAAETFAIAGDGTSLSEFDAAAVWGTSQETLIASADPGVVSDMGGYLPPPTTNNPYAFVEAPGIGERVGTTTLSPDLMTAASTTAADLGGKITGPTRNPFADITGTATQPGTIALPPDADAPVATAPVQVTFPGANTQDLIDGFVDGGTLPLDLLDGSQALVDADDAAILGRDGQPLVLTVADDGSLLIPQATLTGTTGLGEDVSFVGSATVDATGLVSATAGLGATIDGGSRADIAIGGTVNGDLAPTQVTVGSPSLGVNTQTNLDPATGAVTSAEITAARVLGTPLSVGYAAALQDGGVQGGKVTGQYAVGENSTVTGSWQELPYRTTYSLEGQGEVADGVTVGGGLSLTDARDLPAGADPSLVGAGLSGNLNVGFPVGGGTTASLGAEVTSGGDLGASGSVTTGIGSPLGGGIGPLDATLSVEQTTAGETIGKVMIGSSPAPAPAPAPAPQTPAVATPAVTVDPAATFVDPDAQLSVADPTTVAPITPITPQVVAPAPQVVVPTDFMDTTGVDLGTSVLDISVAEDVSFTATDFALDSFDFDDTSFSGTSDFGGFDFGGGF